MPPASKTTAQARRGPKVYYGEKGWRFVRLWQTLLIIVEAGQPLAIDEINRRLATIGEFREFGGKLATTRDDLWTLVRCDFPIRLLDETGEEVNLAEYRDLDSRRGRLKNTRWAMKSGADIGRLEAPRHRRPTSADLTTLSLLRALLSDAVPSGFPLYEQLRTLLDELHRWLAHHGGDRDRGEMISRFQRHGRQYLKRGPASGILVRMVEALQRRVVVEGVYEWGSGSRLIQLLPLAGWVDKERVFVLGARGYDGQLRAYRLDRFESLALRPEMALPALDEEAAQRLLAGSFGGFVAQPEEVELLVDPGAVYLFEEYQFHSSQRLARRKNGSAVVRLTCAVSHSLEEWILGFGEHAEVLAPPGLRDRVAERLRKACERYSAGA